MKHGSGQYQAKKRVGIALRRFLQGDFPSWKYQHIFGCDRDFLRAFIEFQFRGGMRWSNFGDGWVMGHVISPADFDLEDETESAMCWNWINLKPMLDNPCAKTSASQALEILSERRKRFPKSVVISSLVKKAREMIKEEMLEPQWKAFKEESQ